MKQMFIILAVLIGVSLANPIENANTRVIGGENAKDGQFPFMVNLRKENEAFCGGSIISTRYVLTAAHCLIRQDKNIVKVHAATISLLDEGDVYDSEKLIPHERYGLGRNGRDIGLVKVARDFDFANPNIKPAVLNLNYVGEREYVTAMGFGTSGGPSEPQKEILQLLQMMTLSHDLCSQLQNVRTEELCVYAADYKGVCHGDSGSPLVLKGTNHQVGIAVRVQHPYCTNGYPDMYTRLDFYQDWILNNTINSI